MIVSQTVESDAGEVPVQGRCDEAFLPVLDAFLENYRVEEEVGSAVSVVVEGRTVVDIWGGWVDRTRTAPWAENTIVCMMSVAKGIMGIAFGMLIDRGLVDIDEPVASYWPEFAASGKAELPVRYLLDHRAGLPVLEPDRLWPGAMFDRQAMVSALAAQPPLWTPGTVAAYHVHTQGYLLGEIMYRVTGRLFGEFVRDEIATPLGADYWFGVPASEFDRIAPVMPHRDSRLFSSKDSGAPEDSLRALAFVQNPDWSWERLLNSPEFRSMEMPSASGHGNARSVARIYGAVAGGGDRSAALIGPETLDLITTLQHDQIELLQERHYRQGLGLLLNSPGAVYMGPNERAFGHHGIGGSIGFGDRQERLGFGYSVNAMHAVGTNGPRAARLIDAAYSCL